MVTIIYFVCGSALSDTPRLAARVPHRTTGRALDILMTAPGAQFYTGNHWDGSVRGRGGAYARHAGFAFEPHGFPDAPNQPNFPPVTLQPGTIYRDAIIYRFDADAA